MDTHALECLDFDGIRELLAEYAATALGKGLAEHIRPATRLQLVQRWHDQVRELQRLAESRGLPPLGGISDVRDLVRRCAPPLKVTVEDVARIGDTLAAGHDIVGYLVDLPEESVELRHLAERIGDFQSIAERIRAVIDDRGCVRDQASPKLAGLRREIAAAGEEIGSTVDKLIQEPGVRRLMQFSNYTFHSDRLVLPIRTECRGRLPGIVHRTSDSGATIYVEPAQAVELNNRIVNLRGQEDEEIARLLWDLAHEIYINVEQIIKTLEAIAILDLLAAKLRLADDYDMRCPALVDEPRLEVRGARHPLLMRLFRDRADNVAACESVVPIDYRLGDDFDLLIITGPNTGGKTVTLKTIGLLSVMVQAGLPVPVSDGSTFGVFKNVLIDIGDEQSMQQSLSTFSAHLTRQLEMLRKAGPQTLVLIDEIGAGTDPEEGSAIGRAILDELLTLKCRCIVTTHIGTLKEFPLGRGRAENGRVEFNPETLEPTYHLCIGEPGMSNAIEIAQRLGMPRRLVQAARNNLSHKVRQLKSAMQNTFAAKRQAESARQQAEAARSSADQALVQANEARTQLEKKQADFQDWAARVAHLQPGDAVRVREFDRDGRIVRMRLDQQRAEVDAGSFTVEVPLGDVLPPQTPAPPRRPHKPRSAAPVKKPAAKSEPKSPRPQPRPPRGPRRDAPPRKPAPPVPSLTPEQIAQLSAGDAVFVKRFHRDGRIVRIKNDKKIAVVNVGLLEVEAPFDGLALPGSGPPNRRDARPRRRTAPPKPTATPSAEKKRDA